MSELTPRINRIENKTARNLLINGGMDYFQRNLTASAIYGYRSADRWLIGGNTYTVTSERSTDIPTELIGKVNYSLRVSPDAALASPAASDYSVIEQWTEGDFVQASYGKDLKLNFWFKNNKLGIYTVYLQDPSLSGQYYATEFEVTDVNWNKYSISIPHSQADQSYFSGGNGKGFVIGISLMSGVNNHVSNLDTWETGSVKWVSPNQTNFYDSDTNECYLAGVMLTEDTGVDFEFERAGRDYTEELELCQRYFERNQAEGVAFDSVSAAGGVDAEYTVFQAASDNLKISNNVKYKAKKRAIPVMSFYGNTTLNTIHRQYLNAGGTDVGVTVVTNGLESFAIRESGASTGGGKYIYNWQANSEL